MQCYWDAASPVGKLGQISQIQKLAYITYWVVRIYTEIYTIIRNIYISRSYIIKNTRNQNQIDYAKLMGRFWKYNQNST